MIDNQIILTIDMEDWFHSLDPLPVNWNSYERRIEYGTEKILELLAEKKSSATFFVLGDVAKNHSKLIKEIHQLVMKSVHMVLIIFSYINSPKMSSDLTFEIH